VWSADSGVQLREKKHCRGRRRTWIRSRPEKYNVSPGYLKRQLHTARTSLAREINRWKRLYPLFGKCIFAWKLFDFVFEFFPRLHRAKSLNKGRKRSVPTKEKLSRIGNLQNFICCETSWSRTELALVFNLQCNNVAREDEGKCCPYYQNLTYTAPMVFLASWKTRSGLW